MPLPEPEWKDRTLDEGYPEVSADDLYSRNLKVQMRMELIILALKKEKVPMTRFTHEALVRLAEQLDFLLESKEEGDDE